MRQVLSRVSSFLKRSFLRTPPNLEKRLSLLKVAFGGGVLGWLLPFVARAQVQAPSGNAAVAAGQAQQTAQQVGAAAASALTTGPVMGPLSDGISTIFNFVLTIFATLAYLVIYALIFVNTLITDLVIRVAQYNNFVNAKPVQMGWPLVRDVCNMFFIIVLLLIAFSTIIGYQEFHYKKNLPKLLLFAVLINFSKTLIGLLIDFSQVIMLTFVVGFKDAAFGNFAKAFQIPSLLNLRDMATAGGAGLPTTSNIIVALLFGIWIMTIAMTALVVLLIYFIARIIGLWVLLILSPLAFFILGVPSKIGSAVGAAGKNFWGQLSAWLTGGPIVAFFLWLALAVLQSDSSPFKDVGGVGTNAQEEAAVQAVITDIGKPENMLNFIVSVAFMLFGVKTAVEVSGQANPYLGGLAKQVSSGGGPAWQAVRNAPRAYEATKRGAVAVASRLPGSKYLATKANQATGVGGTLFGGAGAAILQAQNTRNEEAKTAATKKLDESLKGLSEQEQIGRLRQVAKKGALDRLRDKAAAKGLDVDVNHSANAAQEKLALLAVSKGGAKALGKEREALLPKDAPKDMKEASKVLYVKQQQIASLNQAEEMAKATGNDKLLDQIKAEREKDPGLYGYAKMATEMNNIDPKSLKADAWGDFAVFMAYARSKGLVDKSSGSLVAGYEDSPEWKAIASGTGNAAKYVRNHAARLKTAEGRDSAKAMYAVLDGDKSETAIGNADRARYLSRMTDDGTMVATAAWAAGSGGGHAYDTQYTSDVEGRSRSVKNVDDLTRNVQSLKGYVRTAMGPRAETLAQRAEGSFTPDQASAVIAAQSAIAQAGSGASRSFTQAHVNQVYAAQAAGVAPAVLDVYDQGGQTLDAEGGRVIDEIIKKAFDDSAGSRDQKLGAAQVITNIDNRALGQRGAVAARYTAALSAQIQAPNGVNKFKEIYNAASPDMQKTMEAKLKNIAKVADEARKVPTARLTSYQKAAMDFQDTMIKSGDDALKRLVGRQGKKKKKGGGP